MKNNKRVTKGLVLILLSMILFTFTHCQPGNYEGEGGPAEQPGRKPTSVKEKPPVPEVEAPKDEEEVVNVAQISVGVRNHEQLLHTFAELTGIPFTNRSVQDNYHVLLNTLPLNNDLRGFLAPNQLAITRFAAVFCAILVTQETVEERAMANALYVPTNRSKIWFDNKEFWGQLSNYPLERRRVVLQRMLNAFFGEDLLSDEEYQRAEDELMALWASLAEEELARGERYHSTERVVTAACTVALASAYTTLL